MNWTSEADDVNRGQFKNNFIWFQSPSSMGSNLFAKIENLSSGFAKKSYQTANHSIHTFGLLDTTVIDFSLICIQYITPVVYTLLYTFRYIQYTHVYFSSKEHEP